MILFDFVEASLFFSWLDHFPSPTNAQDPPPQSTQYAEQLPQPVY